MKILESMDSIWIVCIILFLTLMPYALVFVQVRQSGVSSKNLTFYPTKWNYLLSVLGLAMACLFFFINLLFPKAGVYSWLLFGGVGVIFLISSIVLTISVKNGFLQISDAAVIYCYCRKPKYFALRDIEDVKVVYGYFVIVFRDRKRKAIPMMFSKNMDLLIGLKEGIEKCKNGQAGQFEGVKRK